MFIQLIRALFAYCVLFPYVQAKQQEKGLLPVYLFSSIRSVGAKFIVAGICLQILEGHSLLQCVFVLPLQVLRFRLLHKHGVPPVPHWSNFFRREVLLQRKRYCFVY